MTLAYPEPPLNDGAVLLRPVDDGDLVRQAGQPR
jgi:hypothetical protein